MLVKLRLPAPDPLPKVEDANVEGLLDRIQVLRGDLASVEDADQIRALQENARLEEKARVISDAACMTLAPSQEQLALRDECKEAAKQARSAEHRARLAISNRAASKASELASIMTGIGLLLDELAETMRDVETFTNTNGVRPGGTPTAWRKANQVREIAGKVHALAYRTKHNMEG